jgi:hypothetical protein
MFFLISGIGAIISNNNDVAQPSEHELTESLEASIIWLTDNKEAMLDFDNPILWYFLHRSSQISGDQRLQSLVDAYYKKYINPEYSSLNMTNSIWKGLFKPEFKYATLSFDEILSMNYYSQHFIYAIYCDEELGLLDSIKAQNNAEFCGSLHILNPSCTTHQLMGLRFLQQSRCGNQETLSSTVKKLQSKVLYELTYDPRVLDVYIQRVMMLVESGDYNKVKNIWIQRVLDHQHSDGGWGNFQPLISLNSEPDFFLGFGHGKSKTGDPRAGKTFMRVFGFGNPTSTFHATAQGTLLLTLLIQKRQQ